MRGSDNFQEMLLVLLTFIDIYWVNLVIKAHFLEHNGDFSPIRCFPGIEINQSGSLMAVARDFRIGFVK